MKASRHELLYLFLSILLVVFAGFIYLTFKDRHQVAISQPTVIQKKDRPSNKEKEEQENQEAIKTFEEDLAALEAQPDANKLANAQKVLDQLQMTGDKSSYQGRLTAISDELKRQTEAETAVAAAEGYQSTENLNAAQNLVNGITNKTAKDAFQARIDVVNANIQSYLASLQTEAQPQAEVPQTDQTQDGN